MQLTRCRLNTERPESFLSTWNKTGLFAQPITTAKGLPPPPPIWPQMTDGKVRLSVIATVQLPNESCAKHNWLIEWQNRSYDERGLVLDLLEQLFGL